MDFLFWIQMAALVQIAFVAIAGWDAGWFHFYKLKLHLRPVSRKEHLLHTLNSVLFPATILGVFVIPAQGALLWGVLTCYFVTFVIEVMDVWEEKRSRAGDGGLDPLESVLHFLMGLLRATVLGIFIASQSPSFFSLNAPMQGDVASIPFWVRIMGLTMIVASLPMALLHLVTYLRYKELRTEN